MTFTLHPALAVKDKVLDLDLCSVFLEDEAQYLWLIVVPRREGLARLIDMSPEDQAKVW